ncbi:MAG: CpsD/CapB family tyrosine-protein kinase, partial [Bacteroidaceae bacterium]|nr:CpsD/CapB family tyrosine-protein kinase [Bacteroidaceae bacterium]
EGKTFIASNIAMSESLLGRKVLLIGLDIRKPRIVSLFGLHDKRRGITAYLSGDINDYDTLMAQIMPSGISDHLDLLPSGTIPPNPSELLAKKNIGAAVAYLRNIYDMIIIDTAPVGQVSDTLQLGYLADASIYVVRADYTPKATFSMINSLRDSKKLPSMNLVLNGIDLTNKKYGYYYGYGSSGKGYGYGYGRYGYGRYGYGKSGYGYGYGLYEDGYGYGESADTNEEKDKNN